jgi:hypothetical protein
MFVLLPNHHLINVTDSSFAGMATLAQTGKYYQSNQTTIYISVIATKGLIGAINV